MCSSDLALLRKAVKPSSRRSLEHEWYIAYGHPLVAACDVDRRDVVGEPVPGRRLRSPGAGYSGLPETPGTLRWYSGGVSSTAPHSGQWTGRSRGPETPARQAGNSGQEFLAASKLGPLLLFLVHDARGKNMSINLHHLASY